jgi:hypothetical protein
MTDDPLISGRNENTPWRAHVRVALVVLVVFLIVFGIAYGLYSAFGGKQNKPTMPAPASAMAVRTAGA